MQTNILGKALLYVLSIYEYRVKPHFLVTQSKLLLGELKLGLEFTLKYLQM